MKPLQLVIITRRFWPMSGLAELAVGDLAHQIKRQGHDVEILTARWGKTWPQYFVAREVPVHRIPRPSLRPWSSFRFQRAIVRHLEQKIEEGGTLDGVIVFGLGAETDSVVRAIRQLNLNASVLTRVDHHIDAYHTWSHSGTRKGIASLTQANAVIADSELTREHLLHYGLNESQVHVIPDGVMGLDKNPSALEQSKSRQALSDAHPILAIEPEQPLVVTAANIDNDGGLTDLIDAWPKVVEAYPKAKLWILGDGTHGQQVWNAITSHELVHSVIMPGYFDDLEEIFKAADLYVHPKRTNAGCSGLTRAMATQLCPIATSTRFTDSLVEKDVTGLVLPISNSTAMTEAILLGLKNRELRQRLGLAASQRVIERFSLVEQANKYIKLISKQVDPIAQAAQ